MQLFYRYNTRFLQVKFSEILKHNVPNTLKATDNLHGEISKDLIVFSCGKQLYRWLCYLLNMPNFYERYIHILNHILDLAWPK